MGLKDSSSSEIHATWGQPEELSDSFDPAAPLRPPSSQLRGPLSLYSMTLRIILRNISSVTSLGDMPFRNARPILEECHIPHLILLEESSPHLLPHTEPIWRRNCLRDFIDLRRRFASPGCKEPKSWRKLYFRTKGETEQAKVEAAQRIKDKYAQHRAEKEAKKLVVSDRPLMNKTVRGGGRRFGAAGTGGVTKGQSLLNKAKAGSAAQAKLTAPARGVFRAMGRAQAVLAEIAPEAAGVRKMVRPMVAPKRIEGGNSAGLERLREFSRPIPGSEPDSETPVQSSRRACRTESETAAVEAGGLPRLKPSEVAAAPPLVPAATSRERQAASSASSASSGAGIPSSSTRKPQQQSPPPDIARAERKKLNFFGASRPSSSAAGAGGSSSPTGTSSSSPAASGVEVRGIKRNHSSTAPTKASSNGAGSPQHSASGVRIISSKRPKVESQSSPRISPPPPPPFSSTNREDSIQRLNSTTVQKSSPYPNGTPTRPSIPAHAVAPKDERWARASPAALSSIFAPARPAGRR